jgi:CheY-like chemotaxis protein
LLRAIIPSNITIQKDLSENKIYMVANPTEFHEVIMNICTNAYHAMEKKGGVLTVLLTEATPDPDFYLTGERYCCLTIRDTGMGIPEAIINNIYDPYFTTKDQGKGSGLGLSVVHGIIKSYKGAIDIQSQEKKGTTVRIFLPIIQEPESAQTDLSAPSDNSGHETILLVDDEPAIVKLGTRMLERSGYSVQGKTSSIDALELFKSNPTKFDLVITDMTMPNLLGIDLAKKILKIRKDMPILICTGFSERVDPQTAEAFGIQGYINKPLLMDELIATVRELLDRHRQVKQQ